MARRKRRATVQPIASWANEVETSWPAGVDVNLSDLPFGTELDVHGMRSCEAIRAVEQFLDRAAIRGVSRVRIIHGKGAGVLSSAVRRLLSDSPLVRHHEFAAPFAGSFGATEVTLA